MFDVTALHGRYYSSASVLSLYGRRAGDAVLPRNDDGVSPPIPLGSSGFRFYRNLHSSIFVSLVFEEESCFCNC